VAENKDSGRKKVIKFRIPGDQLIYAGFLLVDLDSSRVLEWGGNAGSSSEYFSVPLDLPWKEFGGWLRTREFQGQVDPGGTSDIQRFIQSRSENIVKSDRMVELISSGDLTTLEYEWAQDLEVALGMHNPEMELIISDLAEEQQKIQEAELDASGMELAFIISPFQGVPLFRLQIDQRVHVRFKNVKNKAVQNYLKSQNIEIKDDRAEAVGRIASMKRVADSKETLIKIQLPGNGNGFILEENTNIKVRTYTPPAKKKDASVMGGHHAGIAGDISLTQFAVFGGLIIGIIILGAIVWSLL
tara:strand:- start:58627 stop:59526 length:900 start_codon:yes stop_codon:yes gene_type:complete